MIDNKPKSQEVEIEIAEYSDLKRGHEDGRDCYLKFRLIKRRTPFGTVRTILDIREYVVDQSKAMYTRKGLYLYPEEIDIAIINLRKAKADLIKYGTHPRNRKSNPGVDKDKR